MKAIKLGLGILVFMALCSCTNKQVYNSLQSGNQLECDKLQTVQRQECINRLGPSYDKYEDERKKLLNKKE